ncbi:MAG: hypothetical protein HY457_01095 [Parcubacteria group bacterium]|nr:hypothetical protein [Parcubacteria group bacterium]
MLQAMKAHLGNAVHGFLHGVPGRSVELSDTSIHGDYIGINPSAAAQGASFEEAMIEFSIGSEGVTFLSGVASGGILYRFRVCYSPEWVFHLTGWGVDGCLSLRQHQGSSLAALILSFPPRFSLAKFDAMMMLGEGMPMVLGVFVRKEKGIEVLKKLYARAYQLYEPDKPEDDLRQFLGPKTPFLPSDSVERKKKAVADAGQNLWVGTEQDVAERLPIIEQGLLDDYPDVQLEALSVFQLSGRVTDGVDLVVGMLKRAASLHGPMYECVLEKALSAASSLLYETHKFTMQRVKLVQWFGSSVIADVHRVSGGSVTPDQMKVIVEVEREVPAHRRWTREHATALRGAMEEVLNGHRSISPESRQDATRALKDFTFPEV